MGHGEVPQREQATMANETDGKAGLRGQQEDVTGDLYRQRSRQRRKVECQNEDSLLCFSFS